METLIRSQFALLLFALITCSCNSGTESSEVTSVPSTVYTKYYYHGPRPQSDTTLYFVTSTKSAFDALFQYNGVDLPVDTIPRTDLNSQVALSIVKYGHRSYHMDLALVYLRRDTLNVEYTSTLLSEHMSFTVAMSMIVMVNTTFRGIKFFENGQLVKSLP